MNNQQTPNWTRNALHAAITLAIACYAMSAAAQTPDAERRPARKSIRPFTSPTSHSRMTPKILSKSFAIIFPRQG